MNTKRKQTVEIIGAPLDLGQSLRGVDMGPSAVRYAGLAKRLETLGYRVRDVGNVQTPVRDHLSRTAKDHFAAPIHDACEVLYKAVSQALEREELPIVLGGDHSIAIGSVGGASQSGAMGLLWIDAHADFNTPDVSPSGNIHGMPLAILNGHGDPTLVNVGRPGAKVDPNDVVIIALRDLDAIERLRLLESGMHIFTMREIDERGIAAVTREALERLRHRERLHVSLDLDSVDPAFAPGVGTPVTGGLSTREAHLLMEIIAEDGRVGSLDVVEINPILDVRNRTAGLAADLVASLLGKRIL